MSKYSESKGADLPIEIYVEMTKHLAKVESILKRHKKNVQMLTHIVSDKQMLIQWTYEAKDG